GRRTRGGLAQRPPPGGDPYGHAPRTHPEPLCPDGGPRPLLTSLHSPPQSATPGHPREDPMTDLPGDPTQRLTDPTRERHPTPTGPAWERHFTLTGPARERHFTPTGSTCERHPTPTGHTRERHATPTSPSDQPSASADTPTTQRTPSLTSGSMEHPASPSHPAPQHPALESGDHTAGPVSQRWFELEHPASEGVDQAVEAASPFRSAAQHRVFEGAYPLARPAFRPVRVPPALEVEDRSVGPGSGFRPAWQRPPLDAADRSVGPVPRFRSAW